MTNNDQADQLANDAANNGLDAEFFDEFRSRLLVALNNAHERGVAAQEFNHEELALLKRNYDWVCARLAELEKESV